MPHRIHLLGSIPLRNAAEVFSTVGTIFGANAPYVPDGETDRPWMAWLGHALEAHPSFELDAEEEPGRPRYGHARYRLKPGAGGITLDGLRHARVAIDSYGEFKRVRDQGGLPTGTKFLFPIATPVCFCSGQLRQSDQEMVEPAYEEAIVAEIRKMASAIPPEDLAIQWDAPAETWTVERGTPTRFGATPEEMMQAYVTRLIRIGEAVPEGVDLIYHFCYGDPGHRHIIEPSSTRIMVDFANQIAAGISRPVALYHMPVPRDRADDAYFTSLSDLAIGPESELCLGLVHHTDGVEGTRRRMATADRYAQDYRIATECGMGRRDPATIARLLEIHAEVAGLA